MVNFDRLSNKLKLLIAYFLFYAVITELLVITHYDQWISGLKGQNWVSAIFYLMSGPFLGVFYVASLVGLLKRKTWGRKFGGVAISISCFTDAKGFAWSVAGGVPSINLYYGSLAIFVIWNLIWLHILFNDRVANKS
jgi:hypothetical protein